MLIQIKRKFIDVSDENSVSVKMRKKRFLHFEEFSSKIKNPTILDIGGRQVYWYRMGFTKIKNSEITLLNISESEISNDSNGNFISHIGDARNMMEFRNNQFDIAFSNSCIEHLGSFENQLKMAKEVMRVGKKFYVQTPNKYFPIEPHFLFPMFQFFPNSLKVFLVMHFKLGSLNKIKNKDEALRRVSAVKLLSLKELKTMFPCSKIKREKFFGLTKSYTVYN